MDKSCEFCESPTKLIEADYYDSSGQIVKTPCCVAQKTNMEFLRKRYDPTDPNSPTLEEVADIETK